LGSLGHGVSDYLGPIGDRLSVEVMTAFARCLRSEARRFDLLDLGSLDLAAEQREALHTGLVRRTIERVYERCPVVSTDGKWEEYLRTRTRKFRANLKRAERRTADEGLADVRIENFSESLFSELIEVERQSWKWQTGTAYLRDNGRRRFLQTVLADPRIRSEIWTCRLNSRLAAFAVVFAGHGVRSYYLPSFCSSHSDAGTFLLKEIVRESFGSGTREVDLLQGDERYKLVWSTSERAVHQIGSTGASLVGWGSLFGLRVRWRLAESPALRAACARIASLRQPRRQGEPAAGGEAGLN
jgi:CelD/BcsL family acetyltransferase involved in cellulose biosynthesis